MNKLSHALILFAYLIEDIIRRHRGPWVRPGDIVMLINGRPEFVYRNAHKGFFNRTNDFIPYNHISYIIRYSRWDQ